MITITTQPTTGRLMAAYRPIVIAANITGNPPVAYCDIYIAGSYYKTISKTQPPFEFDTQDAVQEYIQKFIPSNGGSNVETDILHEVYVKIRSSQFDSNGFIQPDTPIPVQATGSTPPVPGGGTSSNVFWAVNAALQHEDNQYLETHLNTFKNGTWANNVYPLTHRPNAYRLCKIDSDFFPVVNKGNTINCLRLNYKLKGQNTFQQATNCNYGCSPVSFTLNSPLPGASVGVPYTLNIPLSGSAPFVFNPTTMPPWMSGNIVGNVLQLSGTPNAAGQYDVEFEVSNCAGNDLQGFVGVINALTLSCGITISNIGVVVSGQPPGQPYYIYHASWINNGGVPLYVDIEISFDNGATWQAPTNGNQTTNADWFYDLGSTVEQQHLVRLTPYCAVGNPGAPATFNYTPASGCVQPVLTSVSFDANNDIILTWIDNPTWVAMTVQYSYDTINWSNSTGSPNSPRNFGNSINNTGTVYFRLVGECVSGSSAPSNSIAFDTTVGAGGNIQFTNGSIGGSSIDDVTPAFFLMSMGSFPVTSGQTADGLHGGYNGDIYVQATGADPNDTLELFINGSFSQGLYVGPNSGIFTFANVSIAASDNVLIRLVNF
jgi:hypothetical protein